MPDDDRSFSEIVNDACDALRGASEDDQRSILRSAFVAMDDYERDSKTMRLLVAHEWLARALGGRTAVGPT